MLLIQVLLYNCDIIASFYRDQTEQRSLEVLSMIQEVSLGLLCLQLDATTAN